MLKHTGLILPAHINENRVMAVVWSPDGTTLAAALADNTIYTFHRGVMKHLIRVESSNTTVVKKTNHSIRDIAFSPDSAKLAVALGGNAAVHVHKIENDWTCDATLCSEFPQNSPVSCLVWSSRGPMVFGLENGKVRASRIETEMAWTLYSTDSSTVAVAIDEAGSGILSSHADGSVFLYNFTTSDNTAAASRIMTRLSIPRAIAWARDEILVVDGDGQVAFHDARGKALKTFDHGQESSTENSNFACCSSTNSNLVVVGHSGKVHLYNWDEKSESWEEMDSSAANILGTVTAVALRKDGAKLAIGGVRGAVAEFKVTNADDRPMRNAGLLVRNVDSNLVSEISLENDNGLPGSTIWPATSESYSNKSSKPRKSAKNDKLLSFENGTKDPSSTQIAIEPKNKSELVGGFSTWAKKDSSERKKSLIDYISSDIASSPDKSSLTMDLGSMMLCTDDESDSAFASRAQRRPNESTDLFASTIATPLSADGMLFRNLNEAPYDPTVDPPRWRRELFEKNTTRDCPRCGDDAYRAKSAAVASPIRFTRQYTPEELRADFTLQLALLASLSPGLQRILERQMPYAKEDRGC